MFCLCQTDRTQQHISYQECPEFVETKSSVPSIPLLPSLQRLPVQAAPDRRLWRGQVVPAAPVRRRHVHRVLHLHHRRRLQDPHHRAGRQDHQTADLGHRRTGEVQDHHLQVSSNSVMETEKMLTNGELYYRLLLVFMESSEVQSYDTFNQGSV